MIRQVSGFSLILLLLLVSAMSGRAEVLLSEKEVKQALRHGPWPSMLEPDPSNRVSGDADAIELGRTLFHDPGLSRDGRMSCATCHDPDREFTDGLARGVGQTRLDRNTQTLWNVAGHRWYGWSGDTDNLWAQSLTPLMNPDEMAHDPEGLQPAISNAPYAQAYETLFGPMADEAPVDTSVNIAKALAAYLETLRTGQTSFDRFVTALARGDMASAADYPLSAQRGLKLFLGEGRCAFCHSGPAFTNGEFHDAGVPYFLEDGRVDPGRYAGLQALEASPYTLDGAYSDDPDKTGAWAVRNVRFNHADFGTFRVPSLRRVAHTAPYMHDGSLSDLRAVLDHYNQIDIERLHADGEAILRPLNLSEGELDDLEAFLETLSDDRPKAR